MELSFRRLTVKDAKQYRSIRLESLKLHPDRFGASYEEQSRLPKLMFEGALEAPVDERFVIGAFDQGLLIGICGFVPVVDIVDQDPQNAGTLIQMYVRKAYRGRKVGLRLVQATIQGAFSNPSIEQIILGVQNDNLSAIRVYEAAGFRTYDPLPERDGYRFMIINRLSAF